MHKGIFRKLILGLVICLPAICQGVTKEEMEQAQTIATKAYLRYANDGSGYLDDINPKTMAELEAALKNKEKENIKAFKAIPVPSDYAGWDKDQLVEFWAVTAFNSKGLLEKGRGGRIRARSQINKLNISAPQPAANTTATESNPKPTGSTPVPADSAKVVADTTLNAITAEEAALNAAGEIDDADFNTEKAYNYTWVYIVALAILVAVVTALVVFAAKVMRKDESPRLLSSHDEEAAERLEQMEAALADKEVEISMLKKKLESANRQNEELKGKLENISQQLSALKTATDGLTSPGISGREATEPERKPGVRSIYLGRANAKGLFVRADRTLNPGHSVFVLDTSDGYTGTFRVANSPAAWSLGLSNPKEYLDNACMSVDPEKAKEASRVITESAGSALFEGGCWRVTRKARIAFE